MIGPVVELVGKLLFRFCLIHSAKSNSVEIPCRELPATRWQAGSIEPAVEEAYREVQVLRRRPRAGTTKRAGGGRLGTGTECPCANRLRTRRYHRIDTFTHQR